MKMSLEEAGLFFNNTESHIENYYYKFSVNGEIKVQKKTFFRRVFRFFLLTFGYHRQALVEVVVRVVDFLKEKGITRSLSFIEFIGDKNIIPIDISDNEGNELKNTNKKILKLDYIYNDLLENKKSIMDLSFSLSRLQVKFFKTQVFLRHDFDLKHRIRQIAKKNEFSLGILETRILDQLVSIRVLSRTLLKENSLSNAEFNQKLNQFKSFKGKVLNCKHQLQDQVAIQKEKNKTILNRLKLQKLIETFTQKMNIWQELRKDINNLKLKNIDISINYSEYLNEMNLAFNGIYELFNQKYSNLPLEMSFEEINNCSTGLEKALDTLEMLINRMNGCISILKDKKPKTLVNNEVE